MVNLCLQATDDGVSQKRLAPSLNKQRASNVFYHSIEFQKISATRFLPLFNVTGTGSWASPRTIVTIDGLPYTGYPYGIASVDLVPVDPVIIDTLIAMTETGIMHAGPVSGGVIDLSRRPVEDSLAVDVRLFTGSETGDPLIHLFTRPERSHINKNKVGPSFALSISNNRDRWAYRISGGGFFYFSTGSVNDFTITQYNRDLMPRQNRQVKVAGEAVYTIDNNRSIDFFAAGINLFGWEMSPFTSLFNHYTNVSSTGRLRYEDTSSGISMALIRDESHVWTKQVTGALPGAMRATEWTLYPAYNIPLGTAYTLSVFSNLGYIRVGDLSSGNGDKQSLIMEDVTSVQWGGGIRFGYSADRFSSSAGLRLDSQYEEPPEISAELAFHYGSVQSGMLHASLSSVVYFPDYLERYGMFMTTRLLNDDTGPEDFIVSGNPDILPERVHEVKTGYTQTGSSHTFSLELFGRWTDDQVLQQTIRSYRPAETREILRTATYINNGSRFVPGGNVRINVRPFNFLLVSSKHEFIDNSDIRSLPGYRTINELEFLLPLEIVFDVSILYIGETRWKEFTLEPEDDPYLGEGFDGVLQSATLLDISVSRRFEKFYFANGLEVRIQAQNFLNQPYRRIPAGNYIDRAVFVYLSFGL